MAKGIEITNVQFAAARPAEVKRGLLGWVSFRLNGTLQIDGVSLRRTADGRLALSFPGRRDGMGRQRFYLRPLGDVARRKIEYQLFQALGFEEGMPR